MTFYKNQLIEFKLIKNTVERIIWIDDKDNCITIDINYNKAMPEFRKVSELNTMLDDGSIDFVYKDPYNIYFIDSELSEAEVKTRDRRWNMIKDLVSLEPEIYERKNIWKMIERYAENFPKVSVHRNLRVFWQRGSVKNSLVPDYRFSGGRGIRKKLGSQKTGRPKKYNTDNQGINVTEEIEYFFEKGIKKFKESNKLNIRDVYLMILNEYFVNNFYYENGEKKTKLKHNIPSLRQFRYWYNKNSNLNSKTKSINRKGRRKHNLTDRPTLESSDLYISAPGLKYEIDSTIGNFYLVSEKNPDVVIGRPTVYFVRDVFSRMITGMYVGFQNASWIAASMALLNTVSNKVDYCKQYGIEINESDWPIYQLPEALLADRAEYKGHKADQLVGAFGIRIENAPSYRADYKGIIEQAFNMIDNKLKRHLPGSVPKEGLERGEGDYRLDARLTLRSFTQALIKTVLFFNNSKWLKDYNRDEGMIYDNVPLIPLEMWNWGIKNRAGSLKVYSEDYVKLNLLPRYYGSITKNGIRFKKKIYYSCLKAEKEGWFQDAVLNGSWKVNLAYDPRDTTNIYLINEDGTYEICYLLEKYSPYGGMQMDELVAIRDRQEEDYNTYKHTEAEKEVDLSNFHRKISKESQKRYKEETNNPIKSEKINNIRDNRKRERESNKSKETIILGTLDDNIEEIKSRDVHSENRSVEESNPELEALLRTQREALKNE